MIRRTFQHIPGVGPWREKDLWARGILTWDDFPLSQAEGTGISRKADDQARNLISAARNALDLRDLKGLAGLFPPREHWRLYPAFADQAVFFDIETDGAESQVPTVVSLFSATGGLEVFVHERNMEALPEAIARYPLWVTFNGSCFDVPVLKNHFPRLPVPEAHIDLRFVCRRFGLSGGLKEIEDRLGLGRPLHMRGVNGWDAVLLWRAYKRRGDIEALRFLVEYNLYDAFNLRTLMDVIYNRAIDELALPENKLAVFDRGDILYDVTKVVMSYGPTERDDQVLARVRAAAEFD